MSINNSLLEDLIAQGKARYNTSTDGRRLAKAFADGAKAALAASVVSPQTPPSENEITSAVLRHQHERNIGPSDSQRTHELSFRDGAEWMRAALSPQTPPSDDLAKVCDAAWELTRRDFDRGLRDEVRTIRDAVTRVRAALSPQTDAEVKERFCVTLGHEDIEATTFGVFDNGDGTTDDTYYCDPCTKAMSKSGEYVVARRLTAETKGLTTPSATSASGFQVGTRVTMHRGTLRLHGVVVDPRQITDKWGNERISVRWDPDPTDSEAVYAMVSALHKEPKNEAGATQ